MREHRDLYGCELDQKAIDDAKNIFELKNVFIKHFDLIEEAENDAANVGRLAVRAGFKAQMLN